MAEKIRKERIDETNGEISGIETELVQIQILKELKEIKAAIVYSSHKSNIYVDFIAMALIGLGGLTLLSISDTALFGSNGFAALALIIFGLALYVGRNAFSYRFK